VVFNKEEQREILLPAIKDCILDVNIQEGYVKVHVMKGLMD
jgi:16S rRNA processing protein RimM